MLTKWAKKLESNAQNILAKSVQSLGFTYIGIGRTKVKILPRANWVTAREKEIPATDSSLMAGPSQLKKN